MENEKNTADQTPEASSVNTMLDVTQALADASAAEVTAEALTAAEAPQGDVPDETNAPEGDNAPPETPTPVEAPEQGIIERLNQKVARQANLLSAAGIDPLSDMGKQLEDKLITNDMVRNHVQTRTPASQPQNTQPVNDPIAIAQAAIDEAEAVVKAEMKKTQEDTGEATVSYEAMNNVRKAERQLGDARYERQARERDAEILTQQYKRNTDAVTSVARNVPEYASMDDSLKQTLERVTLGVASAIAGGEAYKAGVPFESLNENHMKQFAEQATNDLGVLANHFRELGRQEALGNKPPVVPGTNQPNQQTPVSPANNSGMPASQPDPYAKVGMDNFGQAAHDYARKAQGVA